MYRRKASSLPEDSYYLPRLELDVVHQPKMQTHTHHYIQTYRHPRRHRHHHHHRRPYSYGYDVDYLSDYSSNCSTCGGSTVSDSARVRLYTHDSTDPWSCTCYPRASQKTIPSMMYDGVKCHHPEHKFQPARQDYFAYPWTSQTSRPTKPLEFGYRQWQVKPPSAVTAPPFAYYTSKDDNPLHRKGDKKLKGDKPPPYSAPVKHNLEPLLSAKPSDRRLRRADRRKLAAAPALASVPEMDDGVSPFDSISQVMLNDQPRFDPDSLRLRTVDEPARTRLQSELRYAAPVRALSTPRPRPRRQTADAFPQTPNRIFKGEYVDPNDGQKYQYDIKHGKVVLDGKRQKLKTV